MKSENPPVVCSYQEEIRSQSHTQHVIRTPRERVYIEVVDDSWHSQGFGQPHLINILTINVRILSVVVTSGRLVLTLDLFLHEWLLLFYTFQTTLAFWSDRMRMVPRLASRRGLTTFEHLLILVWSIIKARDSPIRSKPRVLLCWRLPATPIGSVGASVGEIGSVRPSL